MKKNLIHLQLRMSEKERRTEKQKNAKEMRTSGEEIRQKQFHTQVRDGPSGQLGALRTKRSIVRFSGSQHFCTSKQIKRNAKHMVSTLRTHDPACHHQSYGLVSGRQDTHPPWLLLLLPAAPLSFISIRSRRGTHTRRPIQGTNTTSIKVLALLHCQFRFHQRATTTCCVSQLQENNDQCDQKCVLASS